MTKSKPSVVLTDEEKLLIRLKASDYQFTFLIVVFIVFMVFGYFDFKIEKSVDWGLVRISILTYGLLEMLHYLALRKMFERSELRQKMKEHKE